MNRLTFRSNDGLVGYRGYSTEVQLLHKLAAYEDTGLSPEEVAELAKYREAEKDGRLVVLPCKIGMPVWMIARNGVIQQRIVHSIEFDGHELVMNITGQDIGIWEREIGKRVFLSREAAEDVLTEKNGGSENA